MAVVNRSVCLFRAGFRSVNVYRGFSDRIIDMPERETTHSSIQVPEKRIHQNERARLLYQSRWVLTWYPCISSPTEVATTEVATTWKISPPLKSPPMFVDLATNWKSPPMFIDLATNWKSPPKEVATTVELCRHMDSVLDSFTSFM